MSATFIVDNVAVKARLNSLMDMVGPEFLAYFLDTDTVEILQQQTDKRFDTEGEDIGGWVALAPATVDIREMTGFPGAHPINVRTGELKDWITHVDGFAAPAASFGAIMNWPDELPGSNDLYEKFETAQQGKKSSRGSETPARPVISVGAEDVILTLSALAVHMRTIGVVFV